MQDSRLVSVDGTVKPCCDWSTVFISFYLPPSNNSSTHGLRELALLLRFHLSLSRTSSSSLSRFLPPPILPSSQTELFFHSPSSSSSISVSLPLSLSLSFFLVFITLFLSAISSYLKLSLPLFLLPLTLSLFNAPSSLTRSRRLFLLHLCRFHRFPTARLLPLSFTRSPASCSYFSLSVSISGRKGP